jgi:hypothetical protein
MYEDGETDEMARLEVFSDRDSAVGGLAWPADHTANQLE